MTSALLTGRWLPFPITEGSRRLYCLPHAGGSASAFRSWVGRIDGVSVCPLQPPGRETRQGETPYTLMAELASSVASFILDDAPGPYAVYGHSLGALVGFEVVQEIRRRGGVMPSRLIVSGCPAPQWVTPEDPTVDVLSDSQIVSLLRSLGGTPELFLSDPRVLRMILPPIRADLTVKNTYRYAPSPPLEIPITALAAGSDARASVESMLAWRDQTVRGFRTHHFSGGHFAVLEQEALTLSRLGAAMR